MAKDTCKLSDTICATRGNVPQALRLYREWFQNQRHPHKLCLITMAVQRGPENAWSYLIWVSLGVLINMFALGMILAFPAILLPDIMSEKSSMKVDLETGSWLASIIGLAFIPGYLLSAMLMDWCGRRCSHLLLIVPAIVGWAVIYLAQNVTSLVVGRVLGGLTIGGTTILGAVVIGEYTSPQLRGFLLNFKTCVTALGKLTAHALGHCFHWRTVAVAALVLQSMPLLMTLTWPLSPAWLLSKNRFNKSEDSFYRLRGYSQETENEFTNMVRAQKARQAEVTNKDLVGRVKEFIKKFCKKDFLKPFAICAVANAMLECSGRHFFPAYAMQIIEAVTHEKTATIYVVLSIDIVVALGAATAATLASKVRRRTLLLYSGSASVLVLAAFCIHQFLVSRQVFPINTWLSTGTLVIYFILTNLGVGPMPLALMGEIFPLAYKGSGPGLVGIMISFYVMISLKTTPILLEHVGIHGMFTIFGAVFAASLVLIYFIMPETKDRTLQEIEDYFRDGKFQDKDDTRNVIRNSRERYHFIQPEQL